MKTLLFTLGILVGLASLNPARADEPQDIRYVLIHKAGKNWNPDLKFSLQPYILGNPDPSKPNETHFAYLSQLFSEGKIALGGPMLDLPESLPRTEIGTQVGMVISAAGLPLTKADWEKIAVEDPAVKADVLSVEVRTWRVVLEQKPKVAPSQNP